MALKVNIEGGVTIGGEHYPLGTRKKLERVKGRPAKGDPDSENYQPEIPGNTEEIDALLAKGHLADTDEQEKLAAEKAKAVEARKAAEKKEAEKGKGGK